MKEDKPKENCEHIFDKNECECGHYNEFCFECEEEKCNIKSLLLKEQERIKGEIVEKIIHSGKFTARETQELKKIIEDL